MRTVPGRRGSAAGRCTTGPVITLVSDSAAAGHTTTARHTSIHKREKHEDVVHANNRRCTRRQCRRGTTRLVVTLVPAAGWPWGSPVFPRPSRSSVVDVGAGAVRYVRYL